MEITVDGKNVFAATGGRTFDPADPTIIFIHGAGLDHTVWALQARYFAHHGRSVLAVDLPGHGRSEGPPIDNLDGLADWVIALIDAAGLEQAALVGHSLGATIAFATAGQAPERIWALALIGAAEQTMVSPELLNAAEANEHLGLDLIVGWGHGREAHVGGCRTPGMWMIGSGVRLMERTGPDVLYTDLTSTGDYDRGAEAAAAIRCPTLLLLGANDVMTPAKAGRQLAEKISGAQVMVLPNTGHMLMAERPDEVTDALREVV
jgi:pimeloyl-ACP methyl ester carboxylesterase